MKITSWNVNSIKARSAHVQRYLSESAPDVLMIQELKGESFPADDFKALGYDSVFVTQKAYNGVAVLSKTPVTVILDALPGGDSETHARYLEVEIAGQRLINIYAPNGNPVDSEKFPYKLSWLERLRQRVLTLRTDNTPFAIGGDFNVIPEAKDCHDPKAWAQDALYRIESRQALRRLLNLGLTDAFRVFNTQAGQYTFWDYQAGAWQRNNGIRIDHFLLSPEMTDRLAACRIDTAPRGWDKPSDHTPVSIEIAA